jgi:hypothetical protein
MQTDSIRLSSLRKVMKKIRILIYFCIAATFINVPKYKWWKWEKLETTKMRKTYPDFISKIVYCAKDEYL